MAKKKPSIKTGVKKLVDEYKDKVLLVLASFLEREAMQVVEWVKDITRIKKKVRMLVMLVGLIFAGMVLVTFGIAKFVTHRAWVAGG